MAARPATSAAQNNFLWPPSRRIGIGISMYINIRSSMSIYIAISIPITVGNTGNTPPMGNLSPNRRSSTINDMSRTRTRQPPALPWHSWLQRWA